MLKRSHYSKRYVFAGIIGLSLLVISAFVLLQTFSIPIVEKPLMPVASLTFSSDLSVSGANTAPTRKVYTDTQYVDDNIQINISRTTKPGLVYYVADIRLKSLQFFKTAFANETFGRNIHEATSGQANRHKAILAINGDYYGARDKGLIIRNGTLYRDNSNRESLVLMRNGEMHIVDISASGWDLIREGAVQSWSFGPALVKEGKNVIGVSKTDRPDPRTGIGMINPYHYIFICVDGRLQDSKGLKLIEFSQLFLEYGCPVAYNLDGGGTTTMVMNGKVVNRPCYTSERKISDIIYIGLE